MSEWTEKPTTRITVVAESREGKSPAIRRALKPITEATLKLGEEHEA